MSDKDVEWSVLPDGRVRLTAPIEPYGDMKVTIAQSLLREMADASERMCPPKVPA